MINVSNNYKQALTQPRTIDAKITYNSTTINIDDINSIKRSFNSTLFKTIAKQVIIDSNVSIDKDITINPQFGLYLDNQFEYVSLGSYKVKNAPNLNKDTNSYEITAYDKIVDSMVDYGLAESDITYPCTVRDLFVAIFTKLGWSTSGIPSTFVNSTSMIEEDVYSNVNFTYRDVLDELCTISCMFLIDVNGTPTLKQKTTTSETINEDFMSDKNVQIKNQVFFNSLVFSRASNSDNIYRKDDTSIANNGLHEFKVSDLQILSLNWRDNFIDAMWNYIKTFTYYAYEVNTIGITYLEPIDTFTLSTFGSTYSTILLNSDLTIANGVNEKIYANEPLESETEYKYADTTDKRINQTNLIVDKQNGKIDAVVSQVDEIEQELANPTSTKENKYFDLEDALDEPLIDFSLYGETQQDSTTGKNILDKNKFVEGSCTFGNVGVVPYYSSASTYSFTIKPNNAIEVEPNTTYTFNMSYSGNFALAQLTSETKSLGDTGWKTSSDLPFTFTTEATTKYIAFNIKKDGSTSMDTIKSYNYQIELGNQGTNFEPYTNGASPNPDYPQEIHNVSGDNTIEICGKNLFDKDNAIYNNGKSLDNTGNEITNANLGYVGAYTKVKPSTIFTISGVNVVSGITSRMFYFDKNKTFISRSDAFSGTMTFTTPSNCEYVGFQYPTFNFDSSTIQMEKGSTSSEYELYQGNSQLISLGVENLFDKDNVNELNASINSSGTISSNNNCRTIYIPIQPNATYTISKILSSQFRASVYDSTPVINATGTNTKANFSGTTITITSTSNSQYLAVFCYLNTDTQTYQEILDSIQIEKGSKANSYSPYGASYIELNKIEKQDRTIIAQDYFYPSNDRWFLHKEIGKVVLDGSESWAISGSANSTFYTDKPNDLSTGEINMLSNYFKDFKTSVVELQNYGIVVGGMINVKNIDITDDDVAGFKSWLSTHNTEIYYPSSTPTDTEITDTRLLEQLNNLMTLPLYKNMTHITLTPNDLQPTMKIEYYRDTSINNNYLPREEITKYYTKTETNSQIEISNSSIKSDVAEIQTTLDDNGNAINIISNQVQNLQTSTSQQINIINEQLENGVAKVKTTTGYTFDNQGLGITKGEEFKNLITDRNQQISSNNKEIMFMGYDDDLKKTVARIPELESRQATIGVHRTEILYEDNEYWTADFYVGGGN